MIKGSERRMAAVCVWGMVFVAAVGAAGCGGGHATAEPTAGTWTPVATPAATSAPATATQAMAASIAPPPAATATQSTGGATPGAGGWVPPQESLTPGATPWPLPYCITVDAPATAHSGDTITLDFHYKCLLDAAVCAESNVPFRVDWLPGSAFLVSPSSGATPAPGAGSNVSGIVAHGLEGQAEVTVKLAQDFTGNFGVTIYMTGSGLNYRWPEGCPEAEPGTNVPK